MIRFIYILMLRYNLLYLKRALFLKGYSKPFHLAYAYRISLSERILQQRNLYSRICISLSTLVYTCFKCGRFVLALYQLPKGAAGLYFVPKPIEKNALFIYI